MRTVQRFEDSEVDVIQCIKTKEIVHLDEENGILVLPITGDASTIRVTPEIRGLVEDIRTGHRPALVTMAALQAEECATKRQMEAHGNGLSAFMTVMLMATVVAAVCTPAMVFNEAKMGKKARSRLYVKRFGDCDSNLFPKMKGRPDVYGDSGGHRNRRRHCVAMVATQGATKYRRGHPYLPRYAQRCVA